MAEALGGLTIWSKSVAEVYRYLTISPSRALVDVYVAQRGNRHVLVSSERRATEEGLLIVPECVISNAMGKRNGDVALTKPRN